MFASHLFAVVSFGIQQKGGKKVQIVAKKQLIRLSANLGHM